MLGLSGFSYFWGHRYERADAAVEAALDLARRYDAAAGEALATSNAGFFRGVCQGDIAGEAAATARAAELAARAGDEAVEALIRFNEAQMAEWCGDYARSIAISEQVIAAGRRLRLAHLVVWPGWFLGKAYCCLGQYGRALAQLTDAAEVCERIGDRVWKSRLLNTIGWCLGEIGSPERAREFNRRAARIAREVGDPEIVCNSEINLAADHLALGDVERASGYLAPIVEALERPGDPWMRWRYALHAHHLDGQLALRAGDAGRALAQAQAEAEGARRHQAPKIEARALVLAGEAHLLVDARDDAAAALDEAARIAERIGYPRAAWSAYGLQVVLARRAGHAELATRHAARRQALLDGAIASLEDAELRRRLAASTS